MLAARLHELGGAHSHQLQNPRQQYFSDIGEVIADFHDRHRATDIGGRNPQYVTLLKMAQRVHPLVGIVAGALEITFQLLL